MQIGRFSHVPFGESASLSSLKLLPPFGESWWIRFVSQEGSPLLRNKHFNFPALNTKSILKWKTLNLINLFTIHMGISISYTLMLFLFHFSPLFCTEDSPSSISGVRPSQLDWLDSELLHTFLSLPQFAPAPLPAQGELSTSVRPSWPWLLRPP